VLLDVGCGPGWYLRAVGEDHPGWAAVGVDLSPGMARETARHHPALVADARALPFPPDTFDLVLAAHMLYHVPEPARAAAELARLCRPAGHVLVVLNGRSHQAELLRLVSEASGSAVGGGAARLALEDAPDVLAPALAVVATDVRRDEVVVTEPGPVMAYIQSMRPMVEPRLRGFVNWTTVLARCRAALDTSLAEHGQWRTTLDTGVLVCRPHGPAGPPGR
jgi:SAM-dependent methyltransferase